MKMRRILAILAVTCLLFCMAGCGAKEPTTTTTTVALNNGATFTDAYAYVTEKPLDVQVLTIEAELFFPKEFPTDKRGGVVFGNYVKSGVCCTNLEIYYNGSPRLYITDTSGTVQDIVFDAVNVCTGEWLDLAVVSDPVNKKALCYVNGELKQSIDASIPETMKYEAVSAIGGDARKGNGQFFKGKLRSVALYDDARTAEEVAADSKGDKLDTANLIGFYELKDDNQPLADKNGRGPSFKRENREIFITNYNGIKADEYAYSFALVGDTQIVNRDYPEKFSKIYDWLVANAKSRKMKFVIGLGDITDTDVDEEWERGKAEINKLRGVVPFSFVRGNHDSFGQYKNYMSYDEFSDTITGSYNDTMLNTYHEVTVGETKYLFLNLDWALTENIVNWANTVISEHSDYRVIVSMHIYLNPDGTPEGEGDSQTALKYGGNFHGDDLWEMIFSKHKNIAMVISGHKPTDQVVVSRHEGESGNIVTELLVDPQGTDVTYEGVGLVAMLYFSEDGKNVSLEYYSTVREGHYLPENQFEFTLDVD